MRNRKFGVKKRIGSLLLAAAVALSAVGGVSHITEAAETNQGAFGVGVGKEIPDHVFAPFVDIVAYTKDADYASAGSLSLEKMYEDTGILYYNLGFIMADTGNPQITENGMNWSWFRSGV